MFDLLFTQVNHKEIEYLLSDVKEQFIENLYDLIQAYENKETDNNDNQDNTIMAIKLLGRMGHLPRTMKFKLHIDQIEKIDHDYLCLLLSKNRQNNQFKINLSEAVNSIYCFIKNIVEKKQNIPKIAYIDNSYKFLKNTIIKIFRINEEMLSLDFDFFAENINKLQTNLKKNPVLFEMSNFNISEKNPFSEQFKVKKTIIEKIIYCLINFLVLSNIYSNNCKSEIEETFNILSKLVVTNFILLKQNGKEFSYDDKNYLLVKAVIQNMSYRVLLVRGDPNYENLSEPYNFGIRLIEFMLNYFEKLLMKYPNEVSEESYHNFILLIFELIISMTYKKKINKSFAGLLALEKLMNIIQPNIIFQFAFKIMSLIFAFLRQLTDVIDIENKNICFSIGNKVMDIIGEKIKQNPQVNFDLNAFLKLFISNFVSIKEIINQAAIHFFKKISELFDLNPTALLYYSIDSTIKKIDSSKIINQQVNFSMQELIEKHNNLYISQTLQKCVQVLDININEEDIEKNKSFDNNKLILFSTALKTLEFLLSLQIIPFRIIVEDQSAMIDFGEERLVFDMDFFKLMQTNWRLININEKIFKNASDIIITNAQPNPQLQAMFQNIPAPNQEFPQSNNDASN